MALVENIQRQDLNPLEVGMSFRHLMEECDLTQESLAKRVGMGRSSVADFLRMLELPEQLQGMLVQANWASVMPRPSQDCGVLMPNTTRLRWPKKPLRKA